MKSSIRNVAFDTSQLLGIEIISVDQKYVSGSENLILPHRADFFCIIYIQDGHPLHTVDFVPVQLEPQSFLFVGRNRIQFFDQINNFRAKVLLFTSEFFCKKNHDANFLNRTALFNSFDSERQCLVKNSTLVQHCWNLLEREEKLPFDRYKPLLLRNHLENFLLETEREFGYAENVESGSQNQQEIFFNFLDLVEQNFREQKPLAFYQEKLFISGKILAGATGKMSGKTPKQMLTERLILEAKRMLIYDNDAGKTIGYSLGFNEPTNFIKFFKKFTGTTPASFRDSHLISPGK